MQGKIIKGIAGFYYIDTPLGKVYECRAKGIFRKQQIKPLVGDDVCMDVVSEDDASGNVIGYIIQITSKGYNDDIQFSMGITSDGTLNGISLISISETPGLGMNAEKVLVPQYTVEGGIDATVTYSVVKDGTGKTSDTDTSIEAISGATITSKAVNNGVNVGLLYYTNVLKGGQ